MIPLLLKEDTGSTNDDLWKFFEDGCREPVALLAGRQTRGKGQRERRWHSGSTGNLYLSILSFFNENSGKWLPLVPLQTSLLITSILRRHTDVAIGLKWPNDLMIGNRKFGGILVESKSSLEWGLTPVVIGIGLNLNASLADYPEHVRSEAAVLGEVNKDHFPLIDIALEVLYNFYSAFAAFPLLRYREESPGEPTTILEEG
jgi:BirA family biotin operon repressor/biotin-[acetyl-CoA-carboxylase] ligase